MAAIRPGFFNPGLPVTPSPVNADSGVSQLTQFITPTGDQAKLVRALQETRALQLETVKNSGNIYGINRLPWIFTTFDALTNAKDNASVTAAQINALAAGGVAPPQIASGKPDFNSTIIWTANPKSVTWSVSQRAVEAKNKSGTVLHVWRDKTRKSDYDDPKLSITFNSGNIMPQSDNATVTDRLPGIKGISYGLNNFYQFLALVDRPKISASGQANLIHILYRSYIFPEIVLTGFFDPQMVVNFSDDSSNPFQVNSWTANFTIYSTTPRLQDYGALFQAFQQDGLKGFLGKRE